MSDFSIVHFPTLLIGASFIVDGERFIKHSELVFRDAFGLEHYIDPLFDKKLGAAIAETASAAATTVVDTSAKIIKDIKDETV